VTGKEKCGRKSEDGEGCTKEKGPEKEGCGEEKGKSKTDVTLEKTTNTSIWLLTPHVRTFLCVLVEIDRSA
jgi:hypothetical protein